MSPESAIGWASPTVAQYTPIDVTRGKVLVARPPTISLGVGFTSEAANVFPRNFASRAGHVSFDHSEVARTSGEGGPSTSAFLAAQSTGSCSCWTGVFR